MKLPSRRLSAIVLIVLVPRLVAALALGNGFLFADEAGYATLVSES